MTRTTLTNKTTINRLLDGAQRAGEMDQLYWLVEMRVSPTVAGTKQPVIAAAAYPVGWTPVVAVGPDPQLSRHYAEVLLELLKSANRGRLIEFGLALTTEEFVVQEQDAPVYVWGEARWDCVCVVCGGVWRSTTPGEEVCEGCR